MANGLRLSFGRNVLIFWILANTAGMLLLAGAILAAVVTASGVAPVVAGKPYAPIVGYVRRILGESGIVVGDRPDTDGRFARALGYEYGLVLSGVTSANDLPVDPDPDHVAASLDSLVGRLVG